VSSGGSKQCLPTSEPFIEQGVLRNRQRGLAGGYQTGKQQVHIMITATSHPGFTLISNPNFDAAAPHDQRGGGIGRSDLRIIGKLPSTVQGSTRITERQEDAAEFRGATWTDPAWEMRHRPDNGQP
jgi:hypothetical protein